MKEGRNKAPRKPCRHPGCRELVSNGPYCEKHEKKKQEEVKVERIKYDKERGTSASRGYNYRWSQYSKRYRKEKPLCVMCEKEGVLKIAECVDHIVPVDGPDDILFWEPSNHQGLCQKHHSEKTAKEDGSFGNIKKERFL
ncbi:MAG: hypothetical protein A2W11_06155 [Ignavibacteria bacterium RBG_16_35_7]|nr:MAG: hypothetical protein A2W11_06155 [Ignavibacteria bacterium RBG_16_35_7]